MKPDKSKNREMIKRVAVIAWPAVLESFFIQLASFIDSFMVSSLGEGAVAAIGLTTQPKNLILALFIASNMAISALVARRKGEKDRNRANHIFITFIIFILTASVLLGVFAVFAADSIINFMGAEPDTYSAAVEYFRIVTGTIVINAVQTGINAAQRGAGNTRITMVSNLVGNTANIILNYLLIGGHLGFPALGIRGAAIATVAGMFISCIISLSSVFRKNSFVSFRYIFAGKIKPRFKEFVNIVKVGYSVFIEQIMMKVGFLLTAKIAASHGTGAYAAHQVGMNFMGLSFSFGDGLQAAAVALIGISLGAAKPDEAKKYGSICQMFGRIISIVLAMTCLFGAEFIYGMFFSKREIIEYGIQIMHVMIFVVILNSPQIVTMGCLRGAGDTVFTAVISTISAAVVRTICAYLFSTVFGFGIAGVWMGVVADQAIRFIFATIRYRRGKWVNIKI